MHACAHDDLLGSHATVTDFSEEELVARARAYFPELASPLVGNGDDCAVFAVSDGQVVITTDVLVENRHFRRDWSTGRDIGRRAAAQNLADIAAMGAEPVAMTIGLTLPGSTEISFYDSLARGIGERCADAGCAVAGGDLTRGELVVIAVTVVGQLNGRAPLTRSGARPGDRVAVAGTLGWSAAGYSSLAGHWQRKSGDITADQLSALASAQAIFRSPTPPLAAGPAGARAGASAMLDISDGLLKDASRLAQASRVAVVLERDKLAPFCEQLTPLGALAERTERNGCGGHGRDAGVEAASAAAGSAAADSYSAGETPSPSTSSGDRASDWAWQWVLTGGEDHSLLATFGPEATIPEAFTVIGHVSQDPPGRVSIEGVDLANMQVWDHFARGNSIS